MLVDIAINYGFNICVPQNPYVEILNPKLMTLRGRAFGRGLGHESKRVLTNGISIPYKRSPRETSKPLLPYKNTVRRDLL
jgi:hypothetical protein